VSTEPETDLPKLAAPARRALAGAGYTTLEQLAQAREGDIADLDGMGPNAMKTLRQALQEHGLSFRTGGDTRSVTVRGADAATAAANEVPAALAHLGPRSRGHRRSRWGSPPSPAPPEHRAAR
jgi:hypothetical protein